MPAQGQPTFRAGDIVITPTNRRAMLMELQYDGRWRMIYLDQDKSKVALYPELLHPE